MRELFEFLMWKHVKWTKNSLYYEILMLLGRKSF